jgi:hypothetical protein
VDRPERDVISGQFIDPDPSGIGVNIKIIPSSQSNVSGIKTGVWRALRQRRERRLLLQALPSQTRAEATVGVARFG